jgi:hypothetical protein
VPLETLRLTYYINFTQHSTSEADISSVRQEVHSILWHPTFRYRVHKVQPPVLAPATFIQCTVSHRTSFKIHFNISFRLRQRLPKLFIPFTFFHQNTVRTSLPHTSHMPDHPLRATCPITPNNISPAIQITKPLTLQLSPASSNFLLLRLKYLPRPLLV